MTRFLFFFFIIRSLSACDLPKLPATAPELSAVQLVDAGHDLRAKAALLPVVEAEPANATAAWLLSKSLMNLGELDGAFKYADRAVSLDADNAAYHVQLGAVLGRMAEKASIFKQLGLARRAKKELDAGIALDPRNLDGLLGEMMYYFSAPSFLGGDKNKAADFAARIAAVDSVRGWLAQVALARERKDAAGEIEAARKAIAEDANNFDAQSAVAQYYLDRPAPDYLKLEETGCKLLEIDASRPDGWRVLAEVRAASLCWTQMEAILAAGELFNHEDLSPYYAVAADMLHREQRLAVARDYLEKYLAQPAEGSQASHAMARCTLATLLEKEQHPDEAVAQLDLALQEDPSLEAARKDLKRLKGK